MSLRHRAVFRLATSATFERAVHGSPQASLRRAPADADRLAAAGVPVRLVKRAHLESPDRALQSQGAR